MHPRIRHYVAALKYTPRYTPIRTWTGTQYNRQPIRDSRNRLIYFNHSDWIDKPAMYNL